MPGRRTYLPDEFNLVEGQTTDDTQMSIAVADALARHAVPLNFARDDIGAEMINDAIALNFARWFQPAAAGAPEPFDRGNAVSAAIRGVGSFGGTPVTAATHGAATVMAKNAEIYQNKNGDRHTLSNGALMRAVPYGVYLYNLKIDTRTTRTRDVRIAELAMAGSRLTHPDAQVGYAAAAYAILVASLVENGGVGDRAAQALDRCEKYLGAVAADAATADEAKPVKASFDAARRAGNAALYTASSATPFAHFSANLQDLLALHLEGFGAAVFFLAQAARYNVTFHQAIEHCLRVGGDTDTNAAIVGGVVGAYYGIGEIHPMWVNKVLAFSNKSVSKARGERVAEWVLPTRWPELVVQLMAAQL